MSGASYRFEEREDSPVPGSPPPTGSPRPTSRWCAQLPLPVADALLDEIEAEVAAHAEGYEVHSFVDDLPDELLESYCCLLNQLALDAPTGDLEFEEEAYTPEAFRHEVARDRKVGPHACCAASRSRTGRRSRTATCCCARRAPGASSGRRSCTATTAATGSAPRSRPPTCAALQAERPDITEVITQNAEVNAQMIGINDAGSGFRAGARSVAGVASRRRERPATDGASELAEADERGPSGRRPCAAPGWRGCGWAARSA